MTLRKATMRDIPAMLRLINSYATQGIMLPRTEFELSEAVRDFTIAEEDATLVGCAALHFYGPAIAEVRSLAVAPATKGQGTGRLLVQGLEEEAKSFSLDALFAFTYVPGFFAKLGFREVERGELPLKAWKDCLKCPKFTCCDEIAVFKALTPEGDLRHLASAPDEHLVTLPALVPPPRIAHPSPKS